MWRKKPETGEERKALHETLMGTPPVLKKQEPSVVSLHCFEVMGTPFS
jgi:hypothetical protein